MSEFNKVPLKALFSIDKGKKINPSPMPTSRRYIQIEDLRGDGNLKWAEDDQTVVECVEQDVLLAWDGANAGEFGYGLKGAVGSTLAKLSPLNDSVHTPYVGYFLKSQTPYLRSQCTGATIPHVNRRSLEQINIPLPPLPTQRHIAAVLDKAQALVANDKRTLALYDQLAKSLFLEMFGDPVRNERGWEVVAMIDACEQITDGTHFSPPMVDTGYPYVTAKHIKEYGLDFASNPTYVDEEHHAEIYRRCKPAYGDVLYIKDGATTGIAALNTMKEPFSLLSSVALFKPDKTLLTGTYLCYWLNHSGVRENLIRQHMAGAAIRRFTLQKINRFEFVLPPIQLQKRFERAIDKLNIQRASAESSLRRSEGLFGSLLQRAFSGGFGG